MADATRSKQGTVLLDVVTQNYVLWKQVLDFLPLDDVFFDVRAASVAFRLAASGYLELRDDIHASFFRRRRLRPSCVDQAIQRLVTSKTLHYVDFSGLQHFTGRFENVSIFVPLFRGCPLLETLYVVDCPRLEAAAFTQGLDPAIDLKNLKHLYLNGCARIDGKTIGHILHHPTLQIETLHIAGCSSRIGASRRDSWWLDNWQYSPVLKGIRSLDISGLVHWKGNLGSLMCLIHLREFYAQGCRNFKFAHPMSHVLLDRILDTGFLQRIDLESPENVRREIVSIRDKMFVAGPLRYPTQWTVLNWNDPTCRVSSSLCLVALQSCVLTQVYLRGCAAVRNEEVQVLAITCGSTLKVCELVGLQNLSDASLQAIGRFCHVLVDLDVSACFELSDLAIFSVAMGCPKLRCLRMDHLTKITDASLQEITLYLNDLILLSVHGCNRLSQLDRLPPNLVELDIRDTYIDMKKIALPKRLVIKNGRRYKLGSELSSILNHSCSFSFQSKRWHHNEKIQCMWSCSDCDLRPNRALCGKCALQCHRGHRVQLIGLQLFYCDCAVGLSRVACQSIGR